MVWYGIDRHNYDYFIDEVKVFDHQLTLRKRRCGLRWNTLFLSRAEILDFRNFRIFWFDTVVLNQKNLLC